MELTYITSNRIKYEIASGIINESNSQRGLKGIKFFRNELSLPEIQSMDVSEVAIHSAKAAYTQLRKTIAVTDTGFYIEKLKGFPGPFIKYANQCLEPEDILKLLKDQSNRHVVVRECLALITYEGELHTYITEFHGSIALNISNNQGSSVERIFIPQSQVGIIAELSQEEQLSYWKKSSNWH